MKYSVSFFVAYDQYLNLKIRPKKIVMGVPWYGYDYPCLNFSQVRDRSLKKIKVRIRLLLKVFEDQ